MPRPKKSFSPEFGDDAVKLVIESSRPIAQVARAGVAAAAACHRRTASDHGTDVTPAAVCCDARTALGFGTFLGFRAVRTRWQAAKAARPREAASPPFDLTVCGTDRDSRRAGSRTHNGRRGAWTPGSRGGA